MRHFIPPTRRCTFLVWKGYQRRVDVLAPQFNADVKYIPHLFRRKQLRPLDYLYKLIVSILYLIRKRPPYVIVQAPPHYAALPALLLNIPYIIDGHNGIFQSYWHRLPLFSLIISRSQGVIVHNEEFSRLFRDRYPEKPFYVVQDPVQYISAPVARKANQILFVCSFDHDEPVEAIIGTIQQLPEITFVITADPIKLSPEHRAQLENCPNVKLTGFLSTEEYHAVLCSSTAAIALTDMEATQQSGACEALSSNTPLIATRSRLSESLFGNWATLVDNNADSIVAGINALNDKPLDLAVERMMWNQKVRYGVNEVKENNTPLILQPLYR